MNQKYTKGTKNVTYTREKEIRTRNEVVGIKQQWVISYEVSIPSVEIRFLLMCIKRKL